MFSVIDNIRYFVFTFFVLTSASALMQLFVKAKWLAIFRYATGGATTVLLLASIILRTKETGHLPFNSVYEFSLVFSFVLLVLSFVLIARFKLLVPSAILLPVAAVLFAATFSMTSGTTALMPALQSKWRVLHVLTAIISYAAFAVSFAVGVYYLIAFAGKNANAQEKKEKALATEKVVRDFIIAGFIFLTLLLVSGSIWAEEAWGAWWSWDPKETWALVTWLIYAVYLHLHRREKWRGKRSCLLAVIGFVCVIFTLFGVSFLFGGLHSYK